MGLPDPRLLVSHNINNTTSLKVTNDNLLLILVTSTTDDEFEYLFQKQPHIF